jgi:MOSC domain-containing protein YiiM
MTTAPRIISVNVGTLRTVSWGGRRVTSAIWKTPVAGRTRVEGVNLAGDDQADRRVHGGPDKAVYAYASEDYMWWSSELGAEVGPGAFVDRFDDSGRFGAYLRIIEQATSVPATRSSPACRPRTA